MGWWGGALKEGEGGKICNAGRKKRGSVCVGKYGIINDPEIR